MDVTRLVRGVLTKTERGRYDPPAFHFRLTHPHTPRGANRMAEKSGVRHTLSEQQASQLANVTKTVPMMTEITPRWLVPFLQWVPVEAGTFRVNKVTPPPAGARTVECSPGQEVDL